MTTIDFPARASRPSADCAGGAGRGHVVAILPRGEAIRNFVYTEALDIVAAAGELTVLTVAPSADLWESLHARFGRVVPLEPTPEAATVRRLRDLLDVAHGRWLWSAAARERWRLRDREAAGTRARAVRSAKRLLARPFANARGLAALTRVERGASRWLNRSDHYLRLFRRLRPTLVFNGSHVHAAMAVPPVQAAQWLGIPTAAFIFSWDNLTSQGRIIPAYDHYLVWNRAMRDQLLAMYPDVDPARVHVTGTPQFDLHFRPEQHWSRERFCRRVGADPARPIVLYSTGMANHMPGEPEIVRGIADLLTSLREHGPPQLLVRVYPKDRTGRFEALRRERPDILFAETAWNPAWLTPTEEDGVLYTNALRHAAVGINVASTVSLELCMFDKPVLNVGYNPRGVGRDVVDYAGYYGFDHYRPVVASGAVRVADSEATLAALLRDALADPAADGPHRRALLERMFDASLDGASGRRVAAVLSRLAAPRAGDAP